MAKRWTFPVDGKKWQLRFTKNPKQGGKPVCGYCDYERRLITIRAGMEAQLEMDTIQHELDHAAHVYLDEHTVDPRSTEKAGAMWTVGYRRLTHQQIKELGIE